MEEALRMVELGGLRGLLGAILVLALLGEVMLAGSDLVPLK